MQINLIQHTQKIQDFKDRIMDSVQKRQFEEDTFKGILQDTFGKDKVAVFYDDRYLERAGVTEMYVYNGNNHFVLREDSFDGIRNKNLQEIKEDGFLKQFAAFLNGNVHEFSHGVYLNENKKGIDFLDEGLLKRLKNPADEEQMMRINFNLVEKALNLYETPNQVSKAIERQVKRYSSDKQGFGKFLYLHLLDSLKDETIAYMSGFKAEKEILGDEAKFFSWGLTFDEAKVFLADTTHMVRQAYFDKYVPVKNLNRYV
jgi:hypothetical protein